MGASPPEPDDRERRVRAWRRPTMPFERKASISSAAGRWSAVGLEFGLSVVLFFLGGKALDAKLGTGPWLAVVGSLVGVAVGSYLLIRAALRAADRPPEGGSGDPGGAHGQDE